jgi:hypothetical protein
MMEENGEVIDWQTVLPSKLRLALWKRVDQRLHRGDVLITDEQFLELMEEEFKRLVNIAPSAKIRAAMHAMVHRVNQEHPNKYLVFGIKNMMTTYTRTLLDRLGDDSEDALKEGTERIKNMVREGRTTLFLESIGIDLGDKGLPRSIELAIERVVNSKHLDMPLDKLIEPPKKRPIKRPQVKEVAADSDEAMDLLSADMELTKSDESTHIEEIDEEHNEHELAMMEDEQEIASEEIERAHSYLESYHQQGLIDYADVTALRELHSIDDALRAKKIDSEEAERRRGQVENREAAAEKLEHAVQFGVRNIQIFEGLRRLPNRLDEVCRLLIRNRIAAMTQDGDADELQLLIKELDRDEQLLENTIRIIERKDQEVRMIAAHLIPYRYAVSLGKANSWRINESFVDEVRALKRDELSRQLNAPNESQRMRLATDISCLVALISQLVSNTPLYVHVLRLHIRKTVERLYSSAGQANAGRQKVNSFLKQRLPRLYPDLTTGDIALINKESEQIMFSAGSQGDKKGKDDDSMRVFRA